MRIILASHGELSKGILSSTEMIIGKIPKEISTYSLCPGENPQDFVDKLEVEILKNQDEQLLIITDIDGGSVNNACIQLARYPNVLVISGMNLLLVLEIILKKEICNASEIRSVVENAKNGIVLYQNFEKKENQSEEF